MSKFIDKLKTENPRGIDLYFVDYNDELHNKEDQQKILRGEAGEIDYADRRDTGEIIDGIISQTFTDEEREEITDDDRQEISDRIYENDTSDPVKDLCRRTEAQRIFDTGIFISGYGNSDEDDRQKEIDLILETMGATDRKSVELMYSQARDGGNLIITGKGSLSDFLTQGETVSFRGECCLMIIDTGNGSGDYCKIDLNYKAKNEPTRRFVDGNFGRYGIKDIWGERVGDYTPERTDEKIEGGEFISEKETDNKREAEYTATYKAGKCTAGDTKYDRHRNKEYSNNYPCGTRCKDCGQFWID